MNCDICRECDTVKHCMAHGCVPVIHEPKVMNQNHGCIPIKVEAFRPLTLKQRIINVINRWFKQ